MTNKKLTVDVTVSGTPTNPVFHFNPETVTVTASDSKIYYLLNREQSLGLVLAGVVFPYNDQSPGSIVSDITSFKVKDAGYQLSVKDSNKNEGDIGMCLLLTNSDGEVFKSQDPQVKNRPTS
ncbi:DP-EP family protein [Shewanella psychropiezotolerans]|uniref:DP-EP family protein n=1 Tax=Shewanella psychropiezotolerans TaxID=2593655 RepID=A0ABX5X2F1_9GAMM|nr:MULTISPECIES: DP-EP family protein [Shewanella]MPY23429.1 DP-EP family protein [Shewanella sp. YLB-07]QDO85511.1 DP-EP family protein [Shewanella psychropiezotolerans]